MICTYTHSILFVSVKRQKLYHVVHLYTRVVHSENKHPLSIKLTRVFNIFSLDYKGLFIYSLKYNIYLIYFNSQFIEFLS